MSRNRLGLPTALTAAMAVVVALPQPVAAQPAAYCVPQPQQQQCVEKGGHPTIGAVAGGLAGAALGASLGLQIGAMLGGELGARVGKTKCKPGQTGPAYAVYPQGYPPAPYQQPYGYPQAAYPQQAYAQPVYPQAAYPQAAPPAGYATRAYGVWPYGDA